MTKIWGCIPRQTCKYELLYGWVFITKSPLDGLKVECEGNYHISPSNQSRTISYHTQGSLICINTTLLKGLGLHEGYSQGSVSEAWMFLLYRREPSRGGEGVDILQISVLLRNNPLPVTGNSTLYREEAPNSNRSSIYGNYTPSKRNGLKA